MVFNSKSNKIIENRKIVAKLKIGINSTTNHGSNINYKSFYIVISTYSKYTVK